LRFLIRYHTFILFLLLEIFAFIFIARYSSFQRSKIFRVKYALVSGIEKRFDNLGFYFNLAGENKALAQENARLYNMLPNEYFNPTSLTPADTSADKKYLFIGARVINNSINKQYNFLILDKGSSHGIEPEMAVLCKDGIVGVVKETSANFSSVVSVLNREFFPNARIKRNGYFGPIEWPGRHFRKVILREIPLHVDVQEGDTVVTSGYSSIFPPGILVGTVESYKPEEGIFYAITVKLSTDFKRLNDVIVVKNLMREEQLKLEENLEND
jgi:rod shape-determining protein MreC